jgi:phosphatidylserine/phosphatidylglycerophosphate/cardiolipin synthase-like enzyme
MPQIESVIGQDFPKKVIPLIQSAKNSIKIMVFDWRWYYNEPGNPAQLFNHAILTAKNRGVEVKVITNVKDVVKLLNEQGCKAKNPMSKHLVHAKIMIIDDRHLVIGSHNYTQSAFTMNREASIIIRDFADIGPILNFFNSLFS